MNKLELISTDLITFTDSLGLVKVTTETEADPLFDTVTIETKKGIYDLVEIYDDGITQKYSAICHTTRVEVSLCYSSRTGSLTY